VDSPPFRLAQALVALIEPDGGGCRVDGLAEAWAYRKPLPPGEQRVLDALAHQCAGRDWRDVLPLGGPANVPIVRGGVDGRAPLINFLYGPSLNVAGLRAGFLGPGTGTVPFVVPHAATAMLDLRFVVELSPDEIVARIRRHLDVRGFNDVELTVYSAFGHAQTPVNHPAVRAVLDTLAAWRVDAELWPIQAAGGPGRRCRTPVACPWFAAGPSAAAAAPWMSTWSSTAMVAWPASGMRRSFTSTCSTGSLGTSPRRRGASGRQLRG